MRGRRPMSAGDFLGKERPLHCLSKVIDRQLRMSQATTGLWQFYANAQMAVSECRSTMLN